MVRTMRSSPSRVRGRAARSSTWWARCARAPTCWRRAAACLRFRAGTWSCCAPPARTGCRWPASTTAARGPPRCWCPATISASSAAARRCPTWSAERRSDPGLRCGALWPTVESPFRAASPRQEDTVLSLRGSFVALVTPFRDGKVDEPALRSLLRWQLEKGTDGLLPCGTTGEGATLAPEEAVRVVRICVEEARGRVPVVAGCGTNSTAVTIENAL